MDKTKHQRSKSAAKIDKISTELSLDQILKLVNPLGKQTIELEDMKRILQKIPENTRTIVQNIFHSYIFKTKSFLLDVTEFCRIFDIMKNNCNRDSQIVPNKKKEIRLSEHLKTNSVFSEVEKPLRRDN